MTPQALIDKDVAARQKLQQMGVQRIADLGCGLGFESGSFLDAGMGVRAVERDVETAAVAVLNLRGRDARVDLFDVVEDSQALDVVLADIFGEKSQRDRGEQHQKFARVMLPAGTVAVGVMMNFHEVGGVLRGQARRLAASKPYHADFARPRSTHAATGRGE